MTKDSIGGGKGMRLHIVRLALFTGAISCASSAFGAGINPVDVLSAPIRLDLDGIILVQAQSDSSVDQTQTAEIDAASAGDSELTEEILLEFLSDPQAFIADPENAGLIAAVVRQIIARDPANADAIIALVDTATDPAVIDAIADGIAQAAADFANAGDMDASSQILAKVSVAPSALSAAVQSKANEIANVAENAPSEDVSPSEQVLSEEAQDGEASQQIEIVSDEPSDVVSEEVAGTEPQAEEGPASDESAATLTDGETLSEPASDAPSIATTQTSATGGADTGDASVSSTSSTSAPSGGTQNSAQTPASVAPIPSTNTPTEREQQVTPGLNPPSSSQ